jgi:hypothetical protein
MIVGDNTAGGANPAGPWPINGYLSITIPFGHIKTAVKGTNWEGTGVIPDTAVPADKALVVAYVDALQRLIDSTTDPVKRGPGSKAHFPPRYPRRRMPSVGLPERS